MRPLRWWRAEKIGRYAMKFAPLWAVRWSGIIGSSALAIHASQSDWPFAFFLWILLTEVSAFWLLERIAYSSCPKVTPETKA